MTGADFLVVGAGIAGAAIAHALASHGRTVLLEREDQPGYHATGRSAALFLESYGTPQVRALTCASRAFLEQPPQGFADAALLAPRGALVVGSTGDEALLDAQWEVLRSLSPRGVRLDATQARALVPVLRPERLLGATLEPDAADMDVHAIHQGFLRGLRRNGGRLVCGAEALAVERSQGQWQVHTPAGDFSAPLLVNAAGAWCDEVAALAGAAPLGLEPRRRSAFLFAPPQLPGWNRWPMCIAADHGWYIKPDAGMLLGSPANEDPVPPQDVQPEEIDIATGAFRIEQATTLSVRPVRPWAGLRSFVADGDLVNGFDPVVPGFYWLAGQGGYGIQTSPAMAEAGAALVRGLPLPQRLRDFGLTAAMLSPRRLKT